MSNAMKGLIGLSGLAFLLAMIATLFTGPIMGVAPEAFSRACSNLALIAIALTVSGTPGRSAQ